MILVKLELTAWLSLNSVTYDRVPSYTYLTYIGRSCLNDPCNRYLIFLFAMHEYLELITL